MSISQPYGPRGPTRSWDRVDDAGHPSARDDNLRIEFLGDLRSDVESICKLEEVRLGRLRASRKWLLLVALSATLLTIACLATSLVDLLMSHAALTLFPMLASSIAAGTSGLSILARQRIAEQESELYIRQADHRRFIDDLKLMAGANADPLQRERLISYLAARYIRQSDSYEVYGEIGN